MEREVEKLDFLVHFIRLVFKLLDQVLDICQRAFERISFVLRLRNFNFFFAKSLNIEF